MKKDEALEIARTYAKRVRAEIDAGAEIYLFGSAARDEMSERSDIDVAVVSRVFSADVIENRVRLMLLSNTVSFDIEPHPVIQEDWEDVTPFIQEIQRDGILI